MKDEDADLRRLVMQELAWDTRLLDTDLSVDARDGVVTLMGMVRSHGERVAAQEAVQRLQGVRDVVNEIAVFPRDTWTRSDAEIASAVRQALAWNVFVPESRVHSGVSDGLVLLEGEVHTLDERDAAEQAVRNLAGVKGVRNMIEVVPRSAPAEGHRSADDSLSRRTAWETVTH